MPNKNGNTTNQKRRLSVNSSENIIVEVLPTKIQFIQLSQKSIENAKKNLRSIANTKYINKDIYLFGCGLAANIFTGLILGHFSLGEYAGAYIASFFVIWTALLLYLLSNSNEYFQHKALANSGLEHLEYELVSPSSNESSNFEVGS